MRVKILKSTVADGSVYLAGAEVELPEAMAQALINIELAEPVSVSAETPPSAKKAGKDK